MDLGVQKTAAEHDPLQDPLQFGGLQDEPLVGPASVATIPFRESRAQADLLLPALRSCAAYKLCIVLGSQSYACLPLGARSSQTPVGSASTAAHLLLPWCCFNLLLCCIIVQQCSVAHILSCPELRLPPSSGTCSQLRIAANIGHNLCCMGCICRIPKTTCQLLMVAVMMITYSSHQQQAQATQQMVQHPTTH
jgi:hypothetical protein